jgi:tRNA-dihydrouridine synthase A
VTTGALRHGDVPRHLDFNVEEHPVALQLGGSEPEELAHATRLALQWGYDEVNLNCGCPSERVQRGAFGACLMAEAALVRDSVAAMNDAAGGAVPITVKHRIGIDKIESYDFVRDFVGTVADGGCRVFIVHARNAWLKGLSPKENREIPPLRYDLVHRLKAEFPGFTIVVNGGLADVDAMAAQCLRVDGVMIGRAAYHQPWALADWDARLVQGRVQSPVDRRAEVEAAMVSYMVQQQRDHGVAWLHIARHMMGLWHGAPGARRWRQVWSDHRLKDLPPTEVSRLARENLRIEVGMPA